MLLMPSLETRHGVSEGGDDNDGCGLASQARPDVWLVGYRRHGGDVGEGRVGSCKILVIGGGSEVIYTAPWVSMAP